MTTPKLSVDVIIPVYNGADFLGEAIHSVLAQSYRDFVLYVVDDGSTDESAAIAVAAPGVRLVQQPHRGIGAALNLGIRQGVGDLLAFLDADDRWLPAKLERQVAALVADPALEMIFGHVRQFRQSDSEGQDVRPGIHRGVMLVRRAAFERVGAFAEDPGVHGFVDWYARAHAAGLHSLMLSEILYERRLHDANLGRRTPVAQRRSYLTALRLSVSRHKSVNQEEQQ